MRHILFNADNVQKYKIAILARDSGFIQGSLFKTYVTALDTAGVPIEEIWAVNLVHEGKKVPAKLAKAHIAEILPEMDALGTKLLFVTDAEYFKKLTGAKSAEPHLGYVLPCKVKGFEHMNVVYTISDKALYYNPENRNKLDLSVKAVLAYLNGQTSAIQGIPYTHKSFPATKAQIDAEIAQLHNYPILTCDIEAFSLSHHKAGIGSIAFGTSATSGVAFLCDYCHLSTIAPLTVKGGNFPNSSDALNTKKSLRKFFKDYKGKLVFHNAGYDVKVLIYTLFMQHPADYAGMVQGIKTFLGKVEDTKVLAYLALNTTAEISYSLKALAHDYTGNYAQENITNILTIPKDELLQYNLDDACATFHLYNKYKPEIEAIPDLKSAYSRVFQPAIMSLVHTELVGMPIDLERVQEVNKELQVIQEDIRNKLFAIPKVAEFIKYRRNKEYLACHLKWVSKTAPIEHFDYVSFNPNSGDQVAELLHEFLGLPVTSTTPTGKPSTGNDVLKKIKNNTKDQTVIDICEALITLTDVGIILNNFIQAFLTYSVEVSPGVYRLFGNFNLGGTVSGRLSSSKPNLQNIPSGSVYAKLIKECFVSTETQLFVGADYNSLEDYVSALTTRDPNKMKVYLDGYDGHSLRAYSYWPHLMPDITNTVESINSIKELYEKLRSKSKGPTFALTYQGTYHTLMDLGFPEEEARAIEANFKKLYAHSIKWVNDKLYQASKDGYVSLAYGLRLKTPLLKQSIMNSTKTPYEASAEGRTAGNALGQSYGLVNTFAAIQMHLRILASPYATRILPSAQIHDAQYYIIDNDVELVDWFNRNLIECMELHQCPELDHPTVRIGAELDIFYPTWAHPVTIPNNASIATIKNKASGHIAKVYDHEP